MSILINDMEFPTSCLECPLTDGHSASCLITEQSVYFFINKRHNDCPLVPIPPHGRLIDADALIRGIKADAIWEYEPTNEYDSGIRAGAMAVMRSVRNAPTIIPAEESE